MLCFAMLAFCTILSAQSMPSTEPESFCIGADVSEILKDLAKRYGKHVVVVEYQDYRKEVNEIVHRVPDGLGAGAFIWEAASPEWGGLFDSQSGPYDRTHEDL